MKIETAKKLTVPFDRAKLKRTQGMDYIPIAEVVARMNEVMGVGNWRVEILDTHGWGEKRTQLGICPSHIVASVRVHIRDDDTGEWTCGDGMGGQDVNFFKVPDNAPDNVITKGPTNLGDAYKGACSDATKKALQQFGVGLELARDGQALDLSEPSFDIVPYVTRVVDGRPFLTDQQRSQLKTAWKEKYTAINFTDVPDRLEQETKAFVDSFHEPIEMASPELITEVTESINVMSKAEQGQLNDWRLSKGFPLVPEMSKDEANVMLDKIAHMEEIVALNNEQQQISVNGQG